MYHVETLLYQISIMLIFLLLRNISADCGDPLKFRDALPNQDEPVPPTVTPFLSFIGDGQANDLEVRLLLGQTDTVVDTEILGRCYDHESYTEFHCNYLIFPSEPLETEGLYTIQVTKSGSSNHPSRWNMRSIQIDDGTSEIIDVETPTLHLLSFIDFVNGVQECDWQDTQAYQLMAELPTSVDRRSLVDVYEINENGEEYVHSIIVNADQKWADFRQVIRPGTPLQRCYMIQHRLITGEVSDFSEMICHDGSYVINANPRYEDSDDTGLTNEDGTGNNNNGENNIDENDINENNFNNMDEDNTSKRQGIAFSVEDKGCTSSSKSYFLGFSILLFGYMRRKQR